MTEYTTATITGRRYKGNHDQSNVKIEFTGTNVPMTVLVELVQVLTSHGYSELKQGLEIK